MGFALALSSSGNLLSQDKEKEDPPLPERGAVVDIDAPQRTLYKIAITKLGAGAGGEIEKVLRSDFTLVSLFQMLNQKSFLSNGPKYVEKEWSTVGAQGVILASTKTTKKGDQLTLSFHEVGKGNRPSIKRTFSGGSARRFAHEFANQVVKLLTGKSGVFNTRLAFGRRIGKGRKDVFISDYDGHGIGRVSTGEGVNMLPAFGPGGLWYSKLTETGMFITNKSAAGKEIIGGSGLNMGPTICGKRVYFTSTRDGNSEIYSAKLDGTGLKRLTNHPAIDVTATCGPGGKITFVSTRHGYTANIFDEHERCPASNASPLRATTTKRPPGAPTAKS